MVNTDGEAHIASATSQSLEQWHYRFGHLNHSYIDRLIKGKLAEGMSFSSGEVNRECEACAQGKMHRIPFRKKSEKETHQPLQLVHRDFCGPMNVDSVGGSKYVILRVLMITLDMSQCISSRASLKCYQCSWNM